MIDGTEPTPGVQGQAGDPSGEKRLDEFLRRMDAALGRRLSDRHLDEKLAKIKGRSAATTAPESLPPEDDRSAEAPPVEDLGGAWATAAGIIATANDVRDEIIGSAKNEAAKIRSAARELAEHMLEEAILEAEEIRSAARKESAKALAAARRKAAAAAEVSSSGEAQPPHDQVPMPRIDLPLPRQESDQLPAPRIPMQRSSERTDAER